MLHTAELQRVLERARAGLAGPIITAERCAWGFTHETFLLTTPERRAILQIINPAMPPTRVAERARRVPALLAGAGLRAPRLLFDAIDRDPAFVVREYLPGRAGSHEIGRAQGERLLAAHMGAALARMGGIDHAAASLPDTWARPDALGAVGHAWLASLGPLLAPGTRQLVAGALDVLVNGPRSTPVFAHGDFCPVNVLVDDAGALVALIDFDEACLACRWFDAAWWGWVVRYHHPDTWRRTWPVFLEHTGLPPDMAGAALIRATQLLRLAERAARALAAGDESDARQWARRLAETAAWD